MTELYDIYMYDPDNGQLVDRHINVPAICYRSLAMSIHCEGYAIKVFDQQEHDVVYTLGVGN